jgi:hypothetical protein
MKSKPRAFPEIFAELKAGFEAIAGAYNQLPHTQHVWESSGSKGGYENSPACKLAYDHGALLEKFRAAELALELEQVERRRLEVKAELAPRRSSPGGRIPKGHR